MCLHPSVSLNNEKNCREISMKYEDEIAVCEKTAGLRSGNSSDLNSACLKALAPVEIFQFSDMPYESRFLDTFRGHNIRPISIFAQYPPLNLAKHTSHNRGPCFILIPFILFLFIYNTIFCTDFTNTAPSTPRNLTLIVKSNTTISVSWSAPENRNGIIIEYVIRVMEKGANSSRRNVSVLGDATYNRNVNNLKPYTYYVFSIGARTSAGWGEFSEEKTNRTFEGRTYTSRF